MSFDMPPDADLHGECALEIESLNAAMKIMADALVLIRRGFASGRLKDQIIAHTGRPGPTLETQPVSEIVTEALAAYATLKGKTLL
jgi:hypothetical protein